MTRAGSPGFDAASSCGRHARVRWKTPFTFSAKHLVQRGVGIALERRAPVRARVVDEDVQRGLARGELGGERSAARPRCRSRAGSATHSPFFESSAATRVADVLLARRDVDLRAGLDEAVGDHEADAARAAGHERDLAADVEKVRHRGVIAPCRDGVKPAVRSFDAARAPALWSRPVRRLPRVATILVVALAIGLRFARLGWGLDEDSGSRTRPSGCCACGPSTTSAGSRSTREGSAIRRSTRSSAASDRG